MSDPLTMPFTDTQALRRPTLGRAVRSSEIISSIGEIVAGPPILSLPKVTVADTIGRTPRPTLYKPTRWQKVRDFACPCLKPPRVVPYTEAKRARPASRFFGNYELSQVAPEPAAEPVKTPLPGRKPTFMQEFKTPNVALPPTPAVSPEPTVAIVGNVDKNWRTK